MQEVLDALGALQSGVAESAESLKELRKDYLQSRADRMTTRQVQRLFDMTGHTLLTLAAQLEQFPPALEAIAAVVRAHITSQAALADPDCPICIGTGLVSPDSSPCPCLVPSPLPATEGDHVPDHD